MKFPVTFPVVGNRLVHRFECGTVTSRVRRRRIGWGGVLCCNAAVPSIGHPSIVTIVGHANVDIDTSKVVEVKLSVTAYAFSVFTDSDFYHHRWPRISKLES